MTTRPELVIFDCDGVLVDSEPISNAVLAASISEAGLPIVASEASARYQGMLLEDIGSDVERRLGSPLPATFWERFEVERRVAFERSLKAVDGAAETLAAVQAAGIRICVASQARVSKTELTLGLTGLRRYFADDELFSAYGVPRGKPFPDLFLHAAEVMNTPPGSCIVVEDSPTGIRAALAAHMRVVAYVPPGAEHPFPDRQMPTIERLADLVPLVVGSAVGAHTDPS